jgi:hypothetical protein
MPKVDRQKKTLQPPQRQGRQPGIESETWRNGIDLGLEAKFLYSMPLR